MEIKPGAGFTAESWAAATKSVKITGLKTDATINLATGIATSTGTAADITPLQTSTNGTTLTYQAMVVPQTTADNSKLVVITVNGTDYIYRKGYTFNTNTQHKFTITVNQSGLNIDITIGEWNDVIADDNGVAVEDNEIPDNQIWYISSDNQVVTPYNSDEFGARIISNTYSNGKGVITFDGAVTKIGSSAFSECHTLVSITVPNGVTSIGECAFWCCESLTSINIPNGVTSIEEGTFVGCSSLTTINIPDGVTAIGESAFWNCESLTSINIPDGVTTIGEEAFGYCESLTLINIPNSVTTIAEGAFYGCNSLTSLILPQRLTTINEAAFCRCSALTELIIPEGVTSIADYTFYNCI